MTRKQATIAVRSGLNDDEQYGCVVPPIHLSSTYNFTGFNEPRAHDYSRRGNPTRDVTQRALAELEGGAGAVLTNTGMSAIHLVTTVYLKPGDVLVAPHDCYGGRSKHRATRCCAWWILKKSAAWPAKREPSAWWITRS